MINISLLILLTTLGLAAEVDTETYLNELVVAGIFGFIGLFLPELVFFLV